MVAISGKKADKITSLTQLPTVTDIEETLNLVKNMIRKEEA